MSKEYRTIKTEVRLPYELAYGETWSRFFDGLQEKKIYATKCSKCGRVMVPARSFCPRCFVDTKDWLELSPEGTVTTYIYVNYKFYGQPLEPPYVCATIRLDGADVDLLHIIGGLDVSDFELVRKSIATGSRVRAVWNEDRTGHIFDIKYFEPISCSGD